MIAQHWTRANYLLNNAVTDIADCVHCLIVRRTHEPGHMGYNVGFVSFRHNHNMGLHDFIQGPYCGTSYDISQASDWSRPIRSLRYIVTCTRILSL